MKLLNERLINSFQLNAPFGLENGKMGFCLFAFWLARSENNQAYLKVAENLLDNIVCDGVSTNKVDLMNGMAGIGLALRYLLRASYIKGTPNTILKDLDDQIFRHLSYSKYLDSIHVLSLLQILFYMCLRTNDQVKGSESEYLYQELIIETTNYIYHKADMPFFEGSLHFGVTYMLPQYLFLLSNIYKMNFYNYRIIKILEELSVVVLSFLPVLHANRLFLMWGMDSIVNQINMKGWKSHIQLLKERIDINTILKDELRSRNIYIKNGVTGIYLLLSALEKHFSIRDYQLWMSKIIDKIDSSDVWSIVEQEPDYLIKNRGLLSGLSGVSMLLADAKLKYSKR